jgi:hypothetical protein
MKLFSTLLLSLSFIFCGQLNAQSFDMGMLDKASSLLASGQQEKSGQVLGTAMGLLSKTANASSGDFASKILGQTNMLNSILPALAEGNADVSKVQGIISKVKMLVSAMRLKNMVSGGNLAGNSKSVLANVGVLQSGLSGLGSGSQVESIAKSLGKVADKAPKLEKTGLFSGIAKKAVSKKLDSSLGLLGGLL